MNRWDERSWRSFAAIATIAGAFVLSALLLGGCNARTIKLDAKFFPLATLQEVSDGTPVIQAGTVSTIYSTSYTKSVKDLVDAYPVGSVEWDALFFHEQQHAIREFQYPLFLYEYATALWFRWEEEKVGYSAEIRYLRAHGRAIDVDWYAQVLSGDIYGHMTSLEEATAWVKSLLSDPPKQE